MNCINETQYRNIIQQHEQLVKLIVDKTKQLAIIERNRYPQGTCCEYDFEESNGKLCVQFENYSCGEPDYDTYYLPLEFLFDEGYPEKYKIIFENEKQRKIKEQCQHEKEEQEKKIRQINAYDRREYERLKIKFKEN